MVFIPRLYKNHYLALYLMIAEFPFVIVILVLTGIASHDTYTTKLWQDGANNGFNSAPNQIVYALTNGRSYKVPIVWSSLLYNYDLVIGVLSTFLLLVKLPVHVLRFFYPPVGAFVNGACFILYIAAACFQAGSDTSDPHHLQKGAPWYITKSCSVAYYPSNVGYCEQAKALFGFTIMVIMLYFAETVLAIMSCFSTKAEREAVRQRRLEKREEKDAENRALREYDEIINSPMFPPPAMPNAIYTPGLTNPMASPYHQSQFFQSQSQFQFQSLNHPSPSTASDLPFRNYDTPKSSSFTAGARVSVNVSEVSEQQDQKQQPYFPPPPKKATD
ncbi:hypothetical protein UA08_04815 [Talaromyces atroroseus]|uniref:MARVEL domain-containing protein n=1 Tax=Talaromyces atroroseus TaxID=1441469 RepID=A0A225AYT2_TALAT|nr:hypothetical protein UA08_04815 [Talaromyces atroroseus]OKL60126.1 hypothetical protein UA08_04815 [Talaromyces atroroseus]